ncbi:nitroreductase family protein [Chloroflexota bacterium]
MVAICKKKGPWSSAAAWMAAENMALAATGEGIGCVMSTLNGEPKTIIEKLLKIPDTHELATVMCMGIPEEDWPTERAVGEDRPDFSWLHTNTFGNQG